MFFSKTGRGWNVCLSQLSFLRYPGACPDQMAF
jgi:hypothetical protein